MAIHLQVVALVALTLTHNLGGGSLTHNLGGGSLTHNLGGGSLILPVSLPSRPCPLQRMTMHLQFFALTHHLAVRVLPLFYRQLTGGLRWTYFYIPAPFKSSFDGWKGVYSSPTDAPGQDSSTPPPSCAP
ncbi:unnamed protein product [Closterium sp. NIES-53]